MGITHAVLPPKFPKQNDRAEQMQAAGRNVICSVADDSVTVAEISPMIDRCAAFNTSVGPPRLYCRNDTGRISRKPANQKAPPSHM